MYCTLLLELLDFRSELLRLLKSPNSFLLASLIVEDAVHDLKTDLWYLTMVLWWACHGICGVVVVVRAALLARLSSLQPVQALLPQFRCVSCTRNDHSHTHPVHYVNNYSTTIYELYLHR